MPNPNQNKRVKLNGSYIEMFSFLMVLARGKNKCKIKIGLEKNLKTFHWLCKRSLSLKLKSAMYTIYGRSALSYGAECSAMKVEDAE